MHVDALSGWSGGQSQVLGLALGLVARGHRVVIVTRPGSRLAARARELVPVVEVPLRGDWDLPSMLSLRSLFRRLSPEVVHLHSACAHTLGGVAARLAGVPAVLAHKRTDFVPRPGRLTRWRFGRLVDRVVAISDAARQATLAGGVAPEAISVIHSSVDTRHFQPQAVPPACPGVPEGAPLVAAVGSLHARKGHDLLLRVAAGLAGKHPQAWFALVGEGPERTRLQEYAAALGVAHRVVFTGQLEDVRPVLARCRLAVMPSRMEDLGVAALEVMAMGKPLVASRVGGLVEAVADGETGLLVPPEDDGALAAAISRLLADDALCARLGQAARERVEQHFSLDQLAARTEALYREVLEAKRLPVA